jgi:putative redox protein
MAKVVVKSQKNLQHEARMGDKSLIIDEPKDVGGDGKGPSPYETMLAALGACTSMTMLMYARRKGWEIDNIEIELTHEKIHAEDCKTCETKYGRLDKITRDIKIRGNLSQEQMNMLLEIAQKCPVHRTLTNENVITDNIELV